MQHVANKNKLSCRFLFQVSSSNANTLLKVRARFCGGREMSENFQAFEVMYIFYSWFILSVRSYRVFPAKFMTAAPHFQTDLYFVWSLITSGH